MSTSRFSLSDLAGSFLVVTIILCSVLPGCGAFSSARKTARQMQNSTHLRGIHSGCVLYAQGNRDFFPGLDSNGGKATLPLAAVSNAFHGTQSTNGYEPVYRLTVLLRGNYFSPEYLVSPMKETDLKTLALPGSSITNMNFSYALLRIDGDPESGRVKNWKATNNARAIAASDRNTAANANMGGSIHDKGKWSGSVVQNDNSAAFVTSHILGTQFGVNLVGTDNLFADDNDTAGKAGNDAAMVHQDATTYVNQN